MLQSRVQASRLQRTLPLSSARPYLLFSEGQGLGLAPCRFARPSTAHPREILRACLRLRAGLGRIGRRYTDDPISLLPFLFLLSVYHYYVVLSIVFAANFVKF